MTGQSPQKKSGWRGSEDLWLNAAYDLLIDKGVDAVKVLPLAETLGLSRTSFYGHFDSREALLAALVSRWRDRNTGNLIRQITEQCELDQLRVDAYKDGMKSLRLSGAQKVAAGSTTVEEILRVTPESQR